MESMNRNSPQMTQTLVSLKRCLWAIIQNNGWLIYVLQLDKYLFVMVKSFSLLILVFFILYGCAGGERFRPIANEATFVANTNTVYRL